MAAETNVITTTEMSDAVAREIEFTEKFAENITKLIEALGITRKIPKTANSVLRTYKATGTLQDGSTVAEGDIIPLSQYELEAIDWGTMTLKKWRKATTAEAIIDAGYMNAVTRTTDKMLKDVEKGIRTDFFDFLKATTGKSSVSGVGLQACVAKVWGKLQTVFEDSTIESVFFVNPNDVADYLATAQITTQTAFGMSYIENFLGMGTVILNSDVPAGKVYATAKENLVLYYIPVNGADLGEAFQFTSDESGYVGIHEAPDYQRMTAEDVVCSGINLFAEVISGCVIGTIATE